MENDNLSFGVSAFYNETEVISWSGTNAELIGEHDSVGFELESKYKSDENRWLLGISHSFLHLLDWNDALKDTVGSSSQQVSFSDYYYQLNYLEFTGTGNSLSYWAHNHTKTHGRIELFDSWALHMDSRIEWNNQYGDDLLKMTQKAYDNVDIGALGPEDLVDYSEKTWFLKSMKKYWVDIMHSG